ncbi:MAG: Gfo/Idh/MocA family oxidoreductase [Sulfuritalea sp.]|nr:Gfo/Idh/MocA family oxidoreductase [Sulfuritalea sp.]
MRHAIIGAGFGARAHLPAFAAIPGVEIVAIADTGSGRAAELAQPGLAIYSDWCQMLDELRPDSVSVVVPPPVQREIVVSAIGRGIHVLCEKPLGMSMAEADTMMKLAESTTVTAAVGLQYRFEPGMEVLRQQVRSGRLGRIRRLDIDWITAGRADPARSWGWQHDAASGGGVINSFLPHVADLIYWLSGYEVTGVVARTDVLVPLRPDSFGICSEVTAEDVVDALCELGDGAVASMRITNCQRGGAGMRIEVHGEQGLLRFAHRPPFTGQVELHFCHEDGNPEAIEVDKPADPGTDSRVAPLHQLAKLFVAAVQGAISPDLPSFRDGVRSQRLLAAVRHSAALRTFEAL